MASIAERLFGPTQEDHPPSEGKLPGWGRALFGPQEDSTPEMPQGTVSLTQKLFGSQERSDISTQSGKENIFSRFFKPSPDAHPPHPGQQIQHPIQRPKQPGTVTKFIGAIGTAAYDSAHEYDIAKVRTAITPQKPKLTSPPVGPQTNRREWIELQLFKREQIRKLPRSTWADHPAIMEMRSHISSLPAYLQVQEAERFMNSFQQNTRAVKIKEQEAHLRRETISYLMQNPLTTAEWNGYQAWKEQIQSGREKEKVDLKKSKLSHIAGKTKQAARRYLLRVFDDFVTKGTPKATIRDGKLTLEIPDSHIDDQVIFNGTSLLLVNPSSPQDVTSVPINQIDTGLEISIEGPRFLQTLTSLRSAATGSAESYSVMRRGLLVVRPRGRRDEYVRVPMIDPTGFHQALREVIEACKTPQNNDTALATKTIKPKSIRDIIEFDEDVYRYQPHTQKQQEPAINPHDSADSLTKDEVAIIRDMLKMIARNQEYRDSTIHTDNGSWDK